jgi:hypothetical protein
MLITTRISKDKIEVVLFKVSGCFNMLVAFFANLTIIVGVVGAIILIINPTIDEDISQSVIQNLIDKYHSLDPEQKLKIKNIFSEIFLDK